MFSRRRFLFQAILGAGLLSESGLPALAKRASHLISSKHGPHLLALQPWSPAVSADFINLIDNDHCCVASESGRLAIIDLSKTENAVNGSIIAELSGIGQKVLDFGMLPKKAFALVTQENDLSNSQFALAVIHLNQIDTPSLALRLPLDKYLDCTALACDGDLLCVGGTSSTDGNIISVYKVGKGKRALPTLLDVFSLDAPIKSMNLQNNTLVVLHTQETPELSIIDLTNPRRPDLKTTVPLAGNYTIMSRSGDTVLLGGSSGITCALAPISITAKTQPAPLLVPSLSNIMSITAINNRFLLIGESTSEGRVLCSYKCGENLKPTQESIVQLPPEKGKISATVRLAADDHSVVVARGWSGIQMFTRNNNMLEPVKQYVVPRLPAAGLALWGNSVLLAGADLKLYDIAQPTKPDLVTSTALQEAVKVMAGAGSYVLCLSKENLTLRKIAKPDQVSATLQTSGQQICFDAAQQSAYLLKEEKDKTTISRLKIYSDNLVSQTTFDLKPGYSRLYANNGKLLVGGLNDLALYTVGNQASLVGDIHLDNLAIRDFVSNGDNIFATAIDQNSQGFLLVLSPSGGKLNLTSSTNIPHDGVALAVSDETVVTVGSTTAGKNLVSIINVSSLISPKLVKSLPALESASAVTIKDKLAIIAGRGLEIVGLG